ncbi:calcineurin subunit B-like [Drosophila busckii]|uniref:calcineurin subunit B-like n=1 Tax=Drosophila busckii TaxID=30019 RepID=UPI00083F0275|nr:calcineurin subunit B-like [Drosophila busckii]
MGIVASRHLSAAELQQIQTESGFSPHRIDYLHGQYESLERDDEGRVLRSELLKVPPVAAHPLGQRLVDVYLHPSCGFQHFMHGLSRFRRSASLERKLQAILRMYDSDGDGLLSAAQCDELLGQLPATRRELRAMRWKLKAVMEQQQGRQQGYVTGEDLAYITRGVDLDQSLSLRFN